MRNLLEQAINCNDGDHAAKIIQIRARHRIGRQSPTTSFPRRSRPIVSGAPA